MGPAVLIIEPDPDIRDLVSTLLLQTGYSVVIAEGIEEASTIVEDGKVQLVLAASPLVNRDQALEWYRSLCQTIGSRVPTIVFSAHNITLEEARHAGCADGIGKPFDVDDLLTRVRRYLPATG